MTTIQNQYVWPMTATISGGPAKSCCLAGFAYSLVVPCSGIGGPG